jgi:hypothetical protein
MTPEERGRAMEYLLKIKREDDSKKILFVSTSDWVFNQHIIKEAIKRGCKVVGYSSKAKPDPNDEQFLKAITDAGAEMHWSTDCDSVFPAETMNDGLLRAIMQTMDVEKKIKSLSLSQLKKWLDGQSDNGLFTTHTFVTQLISAGNPP